MSALANRMMTAVVNHPLTRWVWSDDWLCVLRAGPECVPYLPSTTEVAMDSWEHLELFEQTESWLSRDHFLALARRRLASGLHVYSIADQGVLASYIWQEPTRAKAFYSEVDQELSLPEKSSTSFHAYTHPAARGKKYYTKCKAAALRWAFVVNGSHHVFTAINPANHASLHVARNLHFRDYALMHRRIRLGRSMKTVCFSAEAAPSVAGSCVKAPPTS